MARPVPEFDELVTLIQACLHNAGEMLADARLLLAADRSPRAHALATLAFEEIGKAFICILAVAPMPMAFFGFRSEGDFWAAWNSHADKLAWARGFLSMLIEEPAVPVAEAVSRLADSTRADHLRKMRGLYVDYSGEAILMPSDITAAEAGELVSDVQAVLDVAVLAWCHDGVRERLREIREQYPSEFNDMMVSVSEAVMADPDAAVRIACQILQQGLSTGEDTAESGTGPEP